MPEVRSKPVALFPLDPVGRIPALKTVIEVPCLDIALSRNTIYSSAHVCQTFDEGKFMEGLGESPVSGYMCTRGSPRNTCNQIYGGILGEV